VSVTKYQAREEHQLLGEAETECNGGYDLVESLNACLRLAEKRWQDVKTKRVLSRAQEFSEKAKKPSVSWKARCSVPGTLIPE